MQRKPGHDKAASCFSYISPSTLWISDKFGTYGKVYSRRIQRRRLQDVWRRTRRGRRILPGDEPRSEEHTSELQSHSELVCRLLLDNKKHLYMHWHGSDVRLPSVHAEREPDSYLAGSSVDEDAIRARISIARRYCDAVFVSTAGLPDYVPDAELVPLALDVAAWRTPRGVEPAVPVVVHLPSRRLTKGSDLVDEALRPLHDEGVVVYRPLSGLSR